MNYDEIYEKAMEKANNGDFEGALKYFDAAIKENENDKRAWVGKASLLMDLGKVDEALKNIEMALKIEKDDYSLALKGVALYEMKNDMAIQFLNEALEMNEKNFIALYWKGVIEGERGNKKEEAELKGNAAFLLFSVGGDAEALKIFKEVYYLNQDLPICYECGIAYATMVDYVLPFIEENEELEKEKNEIIENCWKNRDKVSKPAFILLSRIVEGKEEEIKVENEKDFVFKMLMEMGEEVENGEEEEN